MSRVRWMLAAAAVIALGATLWPSFTRTVTGESKESRLELGATPWITVAESVTATPRPDGGMSEVEELVVELEGTWLLALGLAGLLALLILRRTRVPREPARAIAHDTETAPPRRWWPGSWWRRAPLLADETR